MPTLDIETPSGYHFMVYEKPNHEAATFTVMNFLVPDIKEAVQELKAKGVTFQSYDLPELKTDEDDIMRDNGPTIAWFTDPAGNILSLIEE